MSDVSSPSEPLHPTPEENPTPDHPALHGEPPTKNRLLLFTILGAATTLLAALAFGIYALTTSTSTDHTPGADAPDLPEISTALTACATTPHNHPIADCDLTAANGVTALTRAVNSRPALNGHRQRYLTTLTDHYARGQQCAPGTPDADNPKRLCRTDFLDLAVMLNAATQYGTH